MYLWLLLKLTQCTDVIASNCGKPYTPEITKVGPWSVSISITPPSGADTSKVIIYHIIYRKVGETAWRWVPETSNTSVTISELFSHTKYEISVAAKYQGEEFGPASDLLKVQTKCGKHWSKEDLY